MYLQHRDISIITWDKELKIKDKIYTNETSDMGKLKKFDPQDPDWN